MTYKFKILGFLVLMIISVVCWGADIVPDTNILINDDVVVYDDTFFTAGFATMVLVSLVALCIMTLIGVGIATVLLLILFGIGMAGIISSSIIYGLYKKSVGSAFKATMLLGSSFLGLILCGLIFSVLNDIMHWTSFLNALVSGIVIGTVAGAVTGIVAFKIIKVLTKRLVDRLHLK